MKVLGLRSEDWSHGLCKLPDSAHISCSLCSNGGTLTSPRQGGRENRRCQKPSSRRSKFLPPSDGWLPPAVLSPATSPMSPQTFRTCHFPIPSKDGKQAGELGKLKGAVCPAPCPSLPTPCPVICSALGLGTHTRDFGPFQGTLLWEEDPAWISGT